MATVLSELIKWGWTPADAKVMVEHSGGNWGTACCWSNWLGTSECGRDIVQLWVCLQPFLNLADSHARPDAVRAFAAGAGVLAYG